MNLYELTGELATLESVMEPDENGEIGITDEQLEAYLDLKSGSALKAQNTVHFIRNLESRSESVDSEIKRLTVYKRTCENAVKRIKEYALFCLQGAGLKFIGEKPFSINRQKNSQPAVIVPDGLDLSTWDDRFKKVTVEPNKKAILEAWKAEEPIPANVEIFEGEHIRIR